MGSRYTPTHFTDEQPPCTLLLMQMNKKILCIEDDTFFLNLLSGLLENTPGVRVLGAHSGTEGVLFAKAEKPDLIILDLMLPDIRGSEVLTQLRGDSKKPPAPVIIFSNLSEHEEMEKCLALGAHSYFIKSNTLPSEMVEIVGDVLGFPALSTPSVVEA